MINHFEYLSKSLLAIWYVCAFCVTESYGKLYVALGFTQLLVWFVNLESSPCTSWDSSWHWAERLSIGTNHAGGGKIGISKASGQSDFISVCQKHCYIILFLLLIEIVINLWPVCMCVWVFYYYLMANCFVNCTEYSMTTLGIVDVTWYIGRPIVDHWLFAFVNCTVIWTAISLVQLSVVAFT